MPAVTKKLVQIPLTTDERVRLTQLLHWAILTAKKKEDKALLQKVKDAL